MSFSFVLFIYIKRLCENVSILLNVDNMFALFSVLILSDLINMFSVFCV